MSRVLVTGASGFIGRQTLPLLLARGHEVHAAARRPPAGPDWPDPDPAMSWHATDLLAPGAAEDLVDAICPSHLLHLAWTATPGQFWTAPENLDWVAASLRLYRRFAATGGSRAVFGGSCAEYRWDDVCRLDETASPLEPSTLYGKAKHALGALVRTHAAAAGLSLAWGRIFFLYGPFEDRRRLVADVASSLLAGRPALCSHGRQERDLMHVADIAAAFVALLESPVTGAVNIASGDCRPLAEVIATLAELTGRHDLVRLGARPAPAGDPSRLAATTVRLSQEVGFRPRHTLATGLEDTVAWWRSAQALPDQEDR